MREVIQFSNILARIKRYLLI